MDNEETNAFDSMMPEGTDLDLRNQVNDEWDNKVAYLTHRIFTQTDNGKELLEIWKQSVLMIPL